LASKVYINKKESLCATVSLKQNCPISMCDWHDSTGKLLHSCRPATKKLLSPRHVLVCGTNTRHSLR